MSRQAINLEAKRRRLDDTASALSRPFKSPIRRDVDQKVTETGSSAPDASATPVVAGLPNGAKVLKPISSTTTRGTFQYCRTYASLKTDAELTTLRRKQTSLKSQLASLRSELDTAQQALRIESSSRDEHLRALTVKWRNISQKAADDLFDTAKEKVERMGGLHVWEQTEKERMRRSHMWEDKDFRQGSDGDSDRAMISEESEGHTTKSCKKEGSEDEEVSTISYYYYHVQTGLIRCLDIYNGHDA